MGALKGTVTVRRYIVRGDAPTQQARLMKGISAHVLVPIEPRGDTEKAVGWACIEDPNDLELSSDKVFFGGSLALALRVDTLKPPAALVRRMVDEGLKALGRKPNRSEKQAYKQEVVRRLRGQIFPVTRTHDLVWVFDSGRVLFWSHGKSPNELAIDLFKKSFGLELVPDGPSLLARRALPLTSALPPTSELIFGFPGLPGRSQDEEDADA